MYAARIHLLRPAARWLVCCLVLALAVGGWSSVAVRMLGTSHHHRDHNLQRASAAAMAGWQDFRRASHLHRRAPAEHVFQQRHHHDASDASVVALDTASDPAAQSDSTPSGGDGSVLMFAHVSQPPRAAPCTQHWPAVGGAALPRPHPERLDRPPQA